MRGEGFGRHVEERNWFRPRVNVSILYAHDISRHSVMCLVFLALDEAPALLTKVHPRSGRYTQLSLYSRHRVCREPGRTVFRSPDNDIEYST